jgi:hypothetical protein
MSQASSSTGVGIPTIVVGLHDEFLRKTEFYHMTDVDGITEVSYLLPINTLGFIRLSNTNLLCTHDRSRMSTLMVK